MWHVFRGAVALGMTYVTVEIVAHDARGDHFQSIVGLLCAILANLYYLSLRSGPIAP